MSPKRIECEGLGESRAGLGKGPSSSSIEERKDVYLFIFYYFLNLY